MANKRPRKPAACRDRAEWLKFIRDRAGKPQTDKQAEAQHAFLSLGKGGRRDDR